MDLLTQIRETAKTLNKAIVLPESLKDERNIKAAAILRDEKLVTPVLVGAEAELKSFAAEHGVDSLEGMTIIDPANFDRMDEMVSLYREKRAKENLTEDQAKEVLSDPVFFGAMLVQMGIADGMTAGAIHSTGHVLRATFKCIGPMKGCKTVSSAMLIVLPEDSPMGPRTLTFSDCAFVPDPNAEQLCDIGIAAAGTHKKLVGEEPKVAFLSFSTKGSASTPATEKVVDATELAKKASPELCIDGEMQFDAAMVAKVGELKAPGSAVAGQANVLVFPDLGAANIGYKIAQRLAGAQAIGPISQGLAKPVNDLSRGCNVDDIVQVACITALQGA